MKKLNLKHPDIKEMLSKDQMKKITGGYVVQCICEGNIWGVGENCQEAVAACPSYPPQQCFDFSQGRQTINCG